MRNLRNFIQELEAKDLLFRIDRTVCKDTELMPLVRWQYAALPEEKRKAFLFEKVKDCHGKVYDSSVAVSLLGTKSVYACAAGCAPEQLRDRLISGIANPIEPVVINDSVIPVHEEVHTGDSLLAHGGLNEFPVPISTLGFDPAPFFTSGHWITRDPNTGSRNVGTYRGMVQKPDRIGVMIGAQNQLNMHRNLYHSKGLPYMEAALVLGSPVEVGMASVARIAYGVDELAIAGGIVGEPIRMTKGLTVDLDVPADAEIVIEGRFPTDKMDFEGPFGEFSGYMGMREMQPYFEVTCITHRKNPIYQAYISEMPPSESSVMRGIFAEAQIFKLLRHDVGITGLLDVAVHNTVGSNNYCVLQMKKKGPAEVWQALRCAANFSPGFGKIIIAVDSDINPRDPDLVNWALCYHIQPHRDIEILKNKVGILDPSTAPLTAPHSGQVYPRPHGNSAMLIDATRKWDYPPISLPPKDIMEAARGVWEEIGLPELQEPSGIWYGYELGFWNDELRQLAKDILK